MPRPLLVFLLAICLGAPSQAFAIIPQPQEVIAGSGTFTLSSKTAVVYSSATKGKAKQLISYLKQDLKMSLKPSSRSKSSNYIKLAIDPALKTKAKGAYNFVVTSRGITINGRDKAGVFYGIQTLRQLLPLKGKTAKIKAQTINDEPRYKWRGMMLDVSRYFMDADYVKRYIDMMAMHKLNTFHWHLIDDAGWRIEIKKYPKLTEVGAWRGPGKDRQNGGFYTQEEMKEIVKYAADRHIDVVPEIELPAHTLSSIAAYPYLGCRQITHKVPERHFISRDLYCAGRETTYEFLEDVMKEVFEIFPAKYIHVGGDEAFYDQWKKCEHCQKKIKDENLKNEKGLQGYMTLFFERLCQKEGRNIIGWDEILKCGVSKTAGLMVWHNTRHAYDGAKMGYPVVAAYVRHTYFDTPESKLPGELNGAGWTPPVSLSHSYNWDPRPGGLTDEEAKNILGGHGCLWTDQFLHNASLRDKPDAGDTASEDYVDKLSLPRMAGLAEATWTNLDQKDFARFQSKMRRQYNRYIKNNWKFRLPLPKVKFTRGNKGVKVEAQSSIEGGKVYYTTDGEIPTLESKVLKKPIYVKNEDDFTAFTANHSKKISSLIFASKKNDPRWKKYGTKIGDWKAGQIAAKKAGAKTWQATGLINKNAKYRVTFVYTSGNMRLDTDWVEILKNDQVIHRIKRHEHTNSRQQSSYDFVIKEYETGASFKVRAGIYGDAGNDSNGLVFIQKIK